MGFLDDVRDANKQAREQWAEGAPQRDKSRTAVRDAHDKVKQSSVDYEPKTKAPREPRTRVWSDAAENGHCPDCGGTDLKAKRSGRGKTLGAVFGLIGAAAAPKSRVQCVGCGAEFKRG